MNTDKASGGSISQFPEDFMFRLSQAEKDNLVRICDRFEMLKHSTGLDNLKYSITQRNAAKTKP